MNTKIGLLLVGLLPTTLFAQSNLNPADGPSMGLVAQNNQQGQAQSAGAALNQNNSSLINTNQNFNNGNVITVKMPQKGFWQKMREDTSLSYYQQFLGPTAKGRGDETYNVFQAAGVGPEQKSGRAPVQSFHAVNLRHQLNADWGIGASLAVSQGYAGAVRNRNGPDFAKESGDLNEPKDQFFNARAYVNLPAARFTLGTLFSTISYEAPTSVISREQDMRYGWVIAESFALKLPSFKWTAGVTAQAYRMYYNENVRREPFFFDNGARGTDVVTNMQTLILSGGPYVNYQLTEKWLLGSSVILDWDQRGDQSGSAQFNNNLPHRGRLSATYFPKHPMLKYVSSMGLFTQALLKFRPETTALGAEFSLRF